MALLPRLRDLCRTRVAFGCHDHICVNILDVSDTVSGHKVGYLRVSSVDQNVERQRAAVGQVDKVFEDYASGGSRKRPQLDDMLGYIRNGDQVRVASMDRLARSVIDLNQLTDEILSKGAQLVFVSENLTYSPGDSDPYAQFQMHLLGAVAQLERSLIRERQAEGIAQAKAAGKYLGRAQALSPTEIETARNQIAEGVPKARVARALNISRSTLYRVLTSH